MDEKFEKIRETLEGLEFPNKDLKKNVYKLLNIKEAVVMSRGGDPNPPPSNPPEEVPKPDGGPTEEEILVGAIKNQIDGSQESLRTAVQSLLNM